MTLSRSRRSLAVIALLTAVLAGCATGGAGLPEVTVDGAAPTPVGAQDPAPSPSAPPAGARDCDPRASIRPFGTRPAPNRMPDGSTMAAIHRRGTLIAGVDQNSYRFGFRDPLTGELSGFDIDIARQIAKAIFGDENRIQFRTVTSSTRIDAIRNGEVDLVIATMTMNCERWQQVSFSTEYFTAGQRVLVRRGSGIAGMDDLGGRKVCASAGSTSIRTIAAHPAGPVPVAVSGWTDCLVMLQQNQVDAVSTDDSILAGLAAQDPNTEVVGARFTDEPYGIAIQRGRDDMVRFVNAVLEDIRADGTWARVYGAWLSGLGGGTPAPPAARYR
ncbi:glutamate ABC transporter substrate-binding protein [Catenuloplanes atrovinosus]|uniref:Polar amino acid transport system substrate-binding protein n=1 Tax=Catenuloplanes atrovinosus TaxID=137266 RepID=A0AAE3YLS8_9ACTN|nr:glutamate ABC transporter substrate-binding protein [Catenuloplanes atrovinosus]MDR7275870.1 polar amino acid transport system substrate-binding protein [Catenuloplanes atrovinosus]